MSESFPQGPFARRAATVVLAVYWLTLVTATHWPLRFLPRDKPLLASDKLLHFSAYAGLAFLLSMVVVSAVLPSWSFPRKNGLRLARGRGVGPVRRVHAAARRTRLRMVRLVGTSIVRCVGLAPVPSSSGCWSPRLPVGPASVRRRMNRAQPLRL